MADRHSIRTDVLAAILVAAGSGLLFGVPVALGWVASKVSPPVGLIGIGVASVLAGLIWFRRARATRVGGVRSPPDA